VPATSGLVIGNSNQWRRKFWHRAALP
jgi:hypothetical protein